VKTELWTRRKILKTCATLASGAAFASTSAAWAAAQLPAPEPLTDDRLTFITTTEASAWQQGSIFKPSFAWETLNLNIDAGAGSGLCDMSSSGRMT
jgi:glucosylceramidase